MQSEASIQKARKGCLTDAQNILCIHTGRTPALFTYREQINTGELV